MAVDHIVADTAYDRSIDKCLRLIEEANLLGSGNGQILTVNINDVSSSKTIAKAIEKAKAGAIIFIGKGTYKEQLLTNIPLTLSSFNSQRQVSIEYPQQYILKAQADITIRGINFNVTEGTAIELAGGKANINSCTIQGGKNGIVITSQTVCNIYDNDLISHTISAISVKGEAIGKIENNRIEKCATLFALC